MRKISSIIIAVVILAVLALPAYAADYELNVKFDAEEYHVGDVAMIEVKYNLPHEGDASAYMHISASGLDDVTLAYANTLVCDDTSCNMHDDIEFLKFDGEKITLGAGYSGTATFRAAVENAEEVTFTAKIVFGSESDRETGRSAVADFAAPTTEPTVSPTTKPTQNATDEPNETPKAEQDTTEAVMPEAPKTGARSVAKAAALMCVAGVGCAIAVRKRQH